MARASLASRREVLPEDSWVGPASPPFPSQRADSTPVEVLCNLGAVETHQAPNLDEGDLAAIDPVVEGSFANLEELRQFFDADEFWANCWRRIRALNGGGALHNAF